MTDCLISSVLSTFARAAMRMAIEQKQETFDHLLYTTVGVGLFVFVIAFALLFAFWRALRDESDGSPIPRSRKFIRLGALIAVIAVASVVFIVLSRT